MKPTKLGLPSVGERGAKIAVYGQYGTGKTELVMTAVEVGHLLLVDTEGRSQYLRRGRGRFEVVYSETSATHSSCWPTPRSCTTVGKRWSRHRLLRRCGWSSRVARASAPSRATLGSMPGAGRSRSRRCTQALRTPLDVI
jgi:hypothetical protein